VHHGISHIGIGVRDLDRALAFYEGVLQFSLVDRYTTQVPADPSHTERWPVDGEATHLREVALVRTGPHDDDPVIVLSLPRRSVDAGEPELDDVGAHHVGFWVSDLDAVAARLEAAGVPFMMRPRTFSARGWGRPASTEMHSCLVRDPDGTILQLDQAAE
jgi:catechol 2,3-dioxygenase-like lactoylglutathione lyase family enzyme